MLNELEEKLRDLKVRIYDGAEALEAALKEKEAIIEVLVKIAKAVDIDTTQQMTYDQIVDAVTKVAEDLKTVKTAADTDTAKVADGTTTAPVATTVAPASTETQAVTTAETPVQ